MKNDASFIQTNDIINHVSFAEQLQNDLGGGLPMNDPEVMERIAVALERIAFFLELHVRGEE